MLSENKGWVVFWNGGKGDHSPSLVAMVVVVEVVVEVEGWVVFWNGEVITPPYLLWHPAAVSGPSHPKEKVGGERS